MLVLSRRPAETGGDCDILIGDNIVVRLIACYGDDYGFKCRIGIEAPKGMRVDRREVRESIERDGLREVKGTPDAR